MEEFTAIAQKLSSVTLSTLLIGILYGSYKGIWVWGSQLRRCEEELAQWKGIAMQSIGLAEKSTNIASSVSTK